MKLTALVAHARAVAEVAGDLLLGRYPDFVTGGALPKAHIPVFVLHSADPVDFDRKLAHLDRNGYATVSVEEHFEILVGARAAPERAVCLTFDDGRATVWSVAAPLLERRGMRASVFLVPGRVGDGPPRPRLDDPAGAARDRLLAPEAGEHPFLSWAEVETLARSGVLSFESHTLSHARVHVAPRIVDFFRPALARGPGVMDVPWIRSGDTDLLPDRIPYGTPLLRSAPRTSEAVRLFEDPAASQACAGHVERAGGAAWFERPHWRNELARVARGAGFGSGRRETPAERESSLRHEMTEARRLIESHTDRPTRHLCYPWHAAGPTAERLAREAGYLTAYCGKVPGVRLTLPGGDPHRIARVSEDFVELLPGEGRARLLRVLAAKWTRRFAPRA